MSCVFDYNIHITECYKELGIETFGISNNKAQDENKKRTNDGKQTKITKSRGIHFLFLFVEKKSIWQK